MTSHATAEAYYDHLDDLGVRSAAEIRQISGYEPTHANDDFTADAIRSRLGNVTPGEAVDDTHVEPHDGSNPKYGFDKQAWARNMQNPEQREITLNGIALARKHLAAGKDNRGE